LPRTLSTGSVRQWYAWACKLLRFSHDQRGTCVHRKDRMDRKLATSCITTVPLIVILFFPALLLSAYLLESVSANTLPARISSNKPEKITFASADGDLLDGKPTLLDGYLFRPEGKGPFPALVALHGCSGLFTKRGTLNARFSDWGRRLAGLGYVVLFPDSFNPRGISETCTRRDRSGFSPHKERSRDAHGALLWLQTQSFVQKDRIGLIGWSNGGITLLAIIDSSLEKEGTEDFRVAVAFYPSCTSFSKNQNWRPRIPLTILIGEEDDWTPASSCKALVARAKKSGYPADIVTFPNAYHDFDHPDLPLKTRTGLAFTVNKEGTAKVGTNQAARAAAIELVPKILEQYLKEKGK
jgi:dienelactone hydrolase